MPGLIPPHQPDRGERSEQRVRVAPANLCQIEQVNVRSNRTISSAFRWALQRSGTSGGAAASDGGLLKRVVTPQSRIRSGSQKRQVPACDALPRSFVSPRDCVQHALSVWSEEPRRVPAFGTGVWPDVPGRPFWCPASTVGRHEPSRCTRVAQLALQVDAHCERRHWV